MLNYAMKLMYIHTYIRMCFPLYKDVASQMATAEEYTVPQNLNVNTGT